jgi:hypothetical protein
MRRTFLAGLLTLLLAPAPAAAQSDWTAPVVEAVVTGTEGERGWYRSDVVVTWRVEETDSPESLSTTGCEPQRVTGDTARTEFTCTATSPGGTTTRSWIVKRDTTPPAIECAPPRRWFQGSSQTHYTGKATDALSRVRPPSAFFDATVVGPVAVTLTAKDAAGNVGTQVCTIVVERPGAGPPEQCARTTVQVLDVRRAGSRVRVSGIARTGLAGKTVTLRAALPGRRALGRTIAATVGADGAFSGTLPLPARRHRARVVYEAAFGASRSALALERRVLVTARADVAAGVQVSGRVRGVRRARTVQVLRRVGCARSTVLSRVRTDRSGRFTLTLPRPEAPVSVVTYRFAVTRSGSSAPVVVAR